MRENCYYKELKIKLRQFESLRGKIDKEKETDLEDTIKTIKDALHPKRTPLIRSVEDALKYEYSMLMDDEGLWDICNSLAQYVNDDFPNLPNPRLVINNKDLLDLVHDFFKKATNPYFYNIFSELLKNNNEPYFVTSNNPSFYADSLYLQYDRSFYTQIVRRNEFDDIATIAHEYGHGIQFLVNYNTNFYDNLQVFSELISTFFELLCTEYYAKDTQLGKYAIAAGYEFFDSSCENAFNLSKELQILKSIKNNSNGSRRNINRNISFIVKYGNKKNLREIVEIFPSRDFIYVIGYAFAIELYLIYDKDPDYALYLLRKVIEIDLNLPKNIYFKEIIKLGIVPTANIEQYEAHIKRELTLF